MQLGWLDFKTSWNRLLIDFSLIYMVNDRGSSLPAEPEKNDTYFHEIEQKVYHFDGNNWTVHGPDFFIYDFDAHATQNPFPSHDIIGLRSIQLKVDDKLYYGATMVGIGMFEDTLLFRHDRMIHEFLKWVLPGKMIPLYDFSLNADGVRNPVGMKVMNGTEVLDMAKVDERPIQFIGVEFGSGITA